MSTTAPKPRTVHCPGCGGACVYSPENSYRPFCSARCKNNDFGAWASERFSVDADAEVPNPDPDPDQPTPRPN
jgi:hypothetical protein